MSEEKQYFSKALNWANGVRNKMYAVGMYPHMIEESIKYAERISDHVIFNLNGKTEKKEMREYLGKILTYTFLIELLDAKVKIVTGTRRVDLVMDNSLIKSRSTNRLRKILQSYVCPLEHQYINEFPVNRREATDYYTKVRGKFLQAFQCVLQRYYLRTMDKVINGECVLSVLEFIRDVNNSARKYSADNVHSQWTENEIIIDRQVWGKIEATMERIKEETMDYSMGIQDLKKRLHRDNFAPNIDIEMKTDDSSNFINLRPPMNQEISSDFSLSVNSQGSQPTNNYHGAFMMMGNANCTIASHNPYKIMTDSSSLYDDEQILYGNCEPSVPPMMMNMNGTDNCSVYDDYTLDDDMFDMM